MRKAKRSEDHFKLFDGVLTASGTDVVDNVGALCAHDAVVLIRLIPEAHGLQPAKRIQNNLFGIIAENNGEIFGHGITSLRG